MLEYNNIYGGTLDEGFADEFSRSAKDWSIVKEIVMWPYTEGLVIITSTRSVFALLPLSNNILKASYYKLMLGKALNTCHDRTNTYCPS